MSFKTTIDVFAIPPVWIFKPILDNYEIALFGFSQSQSLVSKAPMGEGLIRPLANSLIIGLSSTFLTIIVASLAAYAFARFTFRGRKNLSVWILSTRMGPPVAIAFPMFFIANSMRLLDTYQMMILAHMTLQLPLAIWVLQGFFRDIPRELEESAMIDGCGRFDAFRRIMLPLVGPALAAVALLALMFSWSDLLFAVILTREVAKTAPLATAGFVEATQGILWGPLSASAMMMTVPILIFALVIQKYIIRGLTFGAVKG